ncbi:DUF1993 domain-containing protein [Paraliomyxa miuraensis]|uniref:DUF1993 domain-containing protein n=1 Tax=Paraliomyxa miuraensis TaxID=376150 RepID=UPI00225B64E5|nr:DUF1993 domain-containing protein [Paraliomyxa miuraensis]MCX4243442.1 DUF1993 domain-containing protein [Paraliomyxa miuraensis]
MSLHDASVTQMSKMLRNLDAWLDKAKEHAKAKEFDVEVLVTSRLAPDQFPLVRQVQSACDSAKYAVARLSGVEAPAHPDEEKTVDELQARIRAVIAYMETVTPDAFEGASDRRVTLPFLPGKWTKGIEYFVDFAAPNFYFHVITAYAILRHNGVNLGKRDFLGHVRLYDIEA